jgi:glycosyltransferase involved in cell wall biosynthesis
VNIHGWFECFCFYQVRALEKRGIPVCLTIHGLLEQKHYQTDYCLKLWSLAKAVNTVSGALIHSLHADNLQHKGLRTIYNGLAIPTNPIKPINTKAPHLVMIGRLTSEKNFNYGFHAVKNLVRKYPNIRLTLVGGGEDFIKLQQLKSELGLDNCISMTDFVRPELVDAYIDQASIVLVPSYYESFCLVALQAAMRGRPVIASDVYGLKEVIEHNKTGLLVKPNDHKEISNAVDNLLSKPEKLITMGYAAYQRAINKFTIQNTTQSYLKMYQEICETSYA